MKVFTRINKLLLREAFFCMLFAFLVLGVVSFIAINLSFFKPFNNAFKDFSYLDLYYAEKLDENQGNVNQNIILMNIDRLDRKEIAYVIDKLNHQKPSVIGLDAIFKEAKDTLMDEALAKSHDIENLITTYAILNSGVVKSADEIARPNQLSGYSNFSFDPETAVVRNFQGFRNDDGNFQTSFGAAVAKRYLQSEWNNQNERYLQKERPINYKGNRENFLVLEYEDILAQESIPLVKDKIVLLGYLGNFQNYKFDIEDKHFTPMNRKFVGKSAPDTFGIVVHANIINMIITDDFISVVPKWFLILMTILITYLALTYFIWLGKRQLASYILRLNIIRLLFMVVLVWIALLLFRNGVLFKTAGIIVVVFFSVGLIGYYKKLAHMLNKKIKWKGYLYQE